MFIHFGDKLNPCFDTSQLEIFHGRCIALQELISTANSQHQSLHPAYQHNAIRPPKENDKETAEQHPCAAHAEVRAQAQLSAHNAVITLPS